MLEKCIFSRYFFYFCSGNLDDSGVIFPFFSAENTESGFGHFGIPKQTSTFPKNK